MLGERIPSLTKRLSTIAALIAVAIGLFCILASFSILPFSI